MSTLKPIGTLVTAILLAGSVWMTAQKPLPAIPLDTEKPAIEAHKDHQNGAVEAWTSERDVCSGTQLQAPKAEPARRKVIGHV